MMVIDGKDFLFISNEFLIHKRKFFLGRLPRIFWMKSPTTNLNKKFYLINNVADRDDVQYWVYESKDGFRVKVFN